jgi:hypothetical protein
MQMNPELRDLLPNLAFTGFKSRYRKPEIKEGFEDIVEVPFVVRRIPHPPSRSLHSLFLLYPLLSSQAGM